MQHTQHACAGGVGSVTYAALGANMTPMAARTKTRTQKRRHTGAPGNTRASMRRAPRLLLMLSLSI